MSNSERNYGVCLILAKLWFIEESFEYEFWVYFLLFSFLSFVAIFMHTCILELGSTSVQWGQVQIGTMTISCLERNTVQRGSEDNDKSITHLQTPKIWYTCILEEEYSALCICIIMIVAVCKLYVGMISHVVTILLFNFTIKICKVILIPFLLLCDLLCLCCKYK